MISQVSKQLNVVTIAGRYRTGKSYMLTRLAGRRKGFPLGSTIQSVTKGIWAWCIDHPRDDKQKLLLLDTEGLGDIKKGDANNDNQLFTLVTLLSSTLIYNTVGAFDQDALNKLHFITEMSKNILTTNERTRTDHDFDLYFPEFILALRDFTLELEIDGQEITSNEYLEYCLQLMQGSDSNTEEYNKPRSCLQKYFKNRKCFIFEQPAKRKELPSLENLNDDQLDEDFVKNLNEFKNYVHESCKPLTLLDGTPVTGRMFKSLTCTYVEAMRDGAIPCIQTALQSMAIQENEKAVADAIESYVAEMKKTLTIPCDSKDVMNAHISCRENAFERFLNGSILDNENVYKAKMDKMVKENCQGFYRDNEFYSANKCSQTLKELRADIETKIKNGSYSKPGGSATYKTDRQSLKTDYFNTHNLGVNKDKTYVKFCQEWETEETGIYNSDKALTEHERLAEVKRLTNEKDRQKDKIDRMDRKEKEHANIQMEKHFEQMRKEVNQLNEKYELEMNIQKQSYEAICKKRKEYIDRLKSEQASALKEIKNEYKETTEKMQIKIDEKDAKLDEASKQAVTEVHKKHEDQNEKLQIKLSEANKKYEDLIQQLSVERRELEKHINTIKSQYSKAKQLEDINDQVENYKENQNAL